MVVGHVGEEDGSGALRGVLLEAEPLAVLLQGELRDVRPQVGLVVFLELLHLCHCSGS